LVLFSRNRKKLVQELSAAVGEAVREALKEANKPKLDDFGSFYEKTLGGMSSFMNGAADVAIRGAASALGQRGGRKTQARKRARIELANARNNSPPCPLCRDPLARNITVEQILEHRRHENGHTYPGPTESSGGSPGEQGADETVSQPFFGQQAIGFNRPDNG
jgi:hypothetical protein